MFKMSQLQNFLENQKFKSKEEKERENFQAQPPHEKTFRLLFSSLLL